MSCLSGQIFNIEYFTLTEQVTSIQKKYTHYFKYIKNNQLSVQRIKFLKIVKSQ